MTRREKILVPGHTLVGRAAPHRSDGKPVASATWGLSRGAGRAKCSCGALSEPLRLRDERVAWHREHRIAVRDGKWTP